MSHSMMLLMMMMMMMMMNDDAIPRNPIWSNGQLSSPLLLEVLEAKARLVHCTAAGGGSTCPLGWYGWHDGVLCTGATLDRGSRNVESNWKQDKQANFSSFLMVFVDFLCCVACWRGGIRWKPWERGLPLTAGTAAGANQGPNKRNGQLHQEMVDEFGDEHWIYHWPIHMHICIHIYIIHMYICTCYRHIYVHNLIYIYIHTYI